MPVGPVSSPASTLSLELAMRTLSAPRSRLLAAFMICPPGLGAQVADSPPPEIVADEFNRGFQTMAWAGLAQRIHPEALAYVRLAVDILMDVDTTGYVLDRLLGGTDPDEYPGLPDEEVVRRTLAGIEREVPGLLSSLTTRRTQILGVVSEDDDRHVVYRTIALVQGAVPRVEVMTLSRWEGRWKVREASDVRTLHTAIRGIPLPRGSFPDRSTPGADPTVTLGPRGP